MKNPNWTKEEDKILLEHYLTDDRSERIISLLKNRNYNAVKARATFLNLRKSKIYHKNENFFEIPNIVNSYWAGILCTDGHIAKPIPEKNKHYKRRDYMVTLVRTLSDIENIKDFLKDSQSNAKILIKNTIVCIKTPRNKSIVPKLYQAAIICICKAAKWASDLEKNWNIPSGNKKFIIREPNITNFENNNFLLSYIKGIIDGDGTIYLAKFKYKKKNGQQRIYRHLSITFLGTYQLLEWIKNFLKKFANYNRKESNVILERKNAKIYQYRITGKDAFILYNTLSNLNCPALARKWNNPEILSFIEQKKAEYPHLFIEPDQSELAKLLPEEKSVNISENKMEIQSLIE